MDVTVAWSLISFSYCWLCLTMLLVVWDASFGLPTVAGPPGVDYYQVHCAVHPPSSIQL